MGFGEAALAGGGRDDRQSRGLGQRDEFFVTLRDAHAIAGDHHRSLGGKQRLRRGGNARRIGCRRWRRQIIARGIQPGCESGFTVPDSESCANSTATGPGCPPSRA